MQYFSTCAALRRKYAAYRKWSRRAVLPRHRHAVAGDHSEQWGDESITELMAVLGRAIRR